MYVHTTDYKFKHIYNIDTLKNYCEYAEKDIKNCEEIISRIRKYQMDLYDHVQEVLNTSYKKVVVLQRSTDYGTNRKYFNVCLDIRPQVEKDHVDGDRITGKHEHSKKFQGRERHLAIRYAEELAKQHNCEIERKGFRY